MLERSHYDRLMVRSVIVEETLKQLELSSLRLCRELKKARMNGG